ncbi:MAG: TonB family protein [Pseudomonadota bacterium]
MAPQVAAEETPRRKPPQRDKKALPPRPQQRVEKASVLTLPREPSFPDPLLPVPGPEPRSVPNPPVPAPAPPETERAASKLESAAPERTSPPVFNAAYLRNPEPRYPISARRRGEQGTVVLKVLVTREGTAASVSVDKGSGSVALDQAALETVRTWRFTPARRGAEPIDSSVLVPIVFRLE